MNVASQILLVGAGGFVGAVSRYALSGAVHRLVPLATFPYGTLAVNGLGCLAIGLLGGMVESRQVLGPAARTFLMIGLLGGFTTFSTFGFETLALMRDGDHLKAGISVVATVVLCLAAVWLGHQIGSLR